ncbi:MAG: DUF5668 domain-containing protein [Candidatus Acidiferrales bacterium]
MVNNWARPRNGLFFGVLIIAVGILFLLDSLGYVTAGYVFQTFWPVILIYFGVTHLLCREGGRRSLWGVALIVIGALFLLSNLGIFNARFGFDTLWPLLIILAGVMMILRTYASRSYGMRGGPQASLPNDPAADASAAPGPADASSPNATGSPYSSRFDGGPSYMRGPWRWMDRWSSHWANSEAVEGEMNPVAIFGGVQQRFSMKNFKGGSIMAFCGGFEIDLTRADIEGDTAVIDASAFMGGGEIRVPINWRIDIRGVAILGAYADETHQEIPAPPAVAKRLIIRGFATLGGVVIKN